MDQQYKQYRRTATAQSNGGDTMLRIDIQNDNQNWLNWGNLVQTWIDNAQARPTNVGELKDQMTKNSVVATVAGANDRIVYIQSYLNSPGDPLVLMIPTPAMRDGKLGTVKPGPYNVMPLFYDIAYAGAPRANLSAQEARDFAVRRIGEYCVNECC
jgi:hypothetical protein